MDTANSSIAIRLILLGKNPRMPTYGDCWQRPFVITKKQKLMRTKKSVGSSLESVTWDNFD